MSNVWQYMHIHTCIIYQGTICGTMSWTSHDITAMFGLKKNSLSRNFAVCWCCYLLPTLAIYLSTQYQGCKIQCKKHASYDKYSPIHLHKYHDLFDNFVLSFQQLTANTTSLFSHTCIVFGTFFDISSEAFFNSQVSWPSEKLQNNNI
jgi:hypothetical protein